MAVTLKRLYGPAQPGISEVAIYTAPGPSPLKTLVKQIKVCNPATTAATVSVSVVASGGAAAQANRILAAKSIPGNETLVLDDFDVFEAGDFLSVLASTATLTVTVSGVEGLA